MGGSIHEMIQAERERHQKEAQAKADQEAEALRQALDKCLTKEQQHELNVAFSGEHATFSLVGRVFGISYRGTPPSGNPDNFPGVFTIEVTENDGSTAYSDMIYDNPPDLLLKHIVEAAEALSR